MNYTNSMIRSAINAADTVVKPLAKDDTPVTVTNKTLQTLIAAAERLLALDDV